MMYLLETFALGSVDNCVTGMHAPPVLGLAARCATVVIDFKPFFAESPGLAPLRDPEVFRQALMIPGEGWTVEEWPECDIQIGADMRWRNWPPTRVPAFCRMAIPVWAPPETGGRSSGCDTPDDFCIQ